MRVAKKVPKAKVVSAFNNIPSEVLFNVFERRQRSNGPSLTYCGDDAGAKNRAEQLIHDVGFEPLDVGGLEMARCTEPLAQPSESVALVRLASHRLVQLPESEDRAGQQARLLYRAGV